MKNLNQFFKYLLLTVVFTGIFVSCSEDEDNVPEKPKTAEEIKAEELAEFKKLIGDGMGTKDFKSAFLLDKQYTKIPSETEIDKMEIMDSNDMGGTDPAGLVFTENGYQLYIGAFGVALKGTSYSLEKTKDGNFEFTVSLEDKATFYSGNDVDETSTGNAILRYEVATKKVTTLFTGYMNGNLLGGSLDIYEAQPMGILNFEYPKPEHGRAEAPKYLQGQRRTSGIFSGVQSVYVELYSTVWFYKRTLINILKPYKNYYVKFTPKTNNNIKVQFCNAQGEVSTSNYNFNTTKHFWANKMPMALNFEEVDFKYNSSTGKISQGTRVMARARPNGKGGFPSFIMGGNKIQNSGDEGHISSIISTNGNSPSNYVLNINLGFKLPVKCRITK